MKNLRIALSAATGLAVATFGLSSLLPSSVATNVADCPSGWYWNSGTQNCVPPGLPNDPPNGCLTADGTHLNGTICAN
ncbi:hypothetical protein [Mycobacterium sp. 852002-51057_SCH5723018]|uniref:hypothetical protein n=1 Tax=Mycobacterium sp. 852002-51057_SCH5723018 TaxID=1834094 RepID=UPI0012E972F0|nr:hypothetical protein [Mycobacterium sp. 852002-51057_SCH5723018]